MADYEIIAQIRKARGLAGELELIPEAEFAEVFSAGFPTRFPLWLIPPIDDEHRLTAITSQRLVSGRSVVFLHGITDRKQAEELVGRYLLADAQFLAEWLQTNGLPIQAQSQNQPQVSATSPDAMLNSSPDGAALDSSALAAALLAGTLAADSSALIGWSVRDQVAGELGVIQAINRDNPQPRWLISDGVSELLIPAVRAYIADVTEGSLTLSLPPGLLELLR